MFTKDKDSEFYTSYFFIKLILDTLEENNETHWRGSAEG